MTISKHFSADYQEARSKFIEASKRAGGLLESYENPNRGPDGGSLFTDTAWHGAEDAENVLVTISGTHGAEGFCGSGVQIAWLEEGLMKELPESVALLQIHAINPHGFAWIRRVTEDNVDLNRNFLSHGNGAYPENPGYDELAEAIAPKTWDDATIAAANQVLERYAEAHGVMALQTAVSGGQYNHADGIFYGGRTETWSNQTMRRIFHDRLSRARRVAVIDYHTGLGPRGYGERICVHAPESEALQRVMEWYGNDATSPYLGTSTSAPLTGVNAFGMEEELGDAEVGIIALEYGTRPMTEVKLALRADNWLHLYGDLDSPKGKAIKADIRDAFYQDADDWKEMIWERALETQRLAIRGLTG
jgi:hypothetical protein